MYRNQNCSYFILVICFSPLFEEFLIFIDVSAFLIEGLEFFLVGDTCITLNKDGKKILNLGEFLLLKTFFLEHLGGDMSNALYTFVSKKMVILKCHFYLFN